MNLIKHLHQINLQESDNEIKGIMKVIKSLENRGILLKGTTRKIIKQEGKFLNFLRPLIATGLHLMKSGLTVLAKVALLPFKKCHQQIKLFKRKFMDQEIHH